MLSRGDNIELLVGRTIASLDRNGDQVSAEISSIGIDVEALIVRGLDLYAGERAGGGIVSRVRLSSGAGVKNSACARDSDDSRSSRGSDS